jgi:hypothetical protein
LQNRAFSLPAMVTAYLPVDPLPDSQTRCKASVECRKALDGGCFSGNFFGLFRNMKSVKKVFTIVVYLHIFANKFNALAAFMGVG